MTPIELQAALNAGVRLRIVDVREPDEYAIGHLPGAELLPLSRFAYEEKGRFRPDEAILVYCHHGMRSAVAANYLEKRGLQDVTNLAGGIDAWSVAVDPSVRRY
jgi:rhodanese-related sulfurtransferase